MKLAGLNNSPPYRKNDGEIVTRPSFSWFPRTGRNLSASYGEFGELDR